jgi:uncharacterized membrane protein YoaK (UPF0700 family)
MYSVGVFHAWDFLMVIILTGSYFVCPKNIIEKKNEYIKFFLVFLSIFFFVFIIVTNVIQDEDITHSLVYITLIPALFCFHMLYPFKTIKRNQNLNFFLLFLSLYIIAVHGLIYILVLFSDM